MTTGRFGLLLLLLALADATGVGAIAGTEHPPDASRFGDDRRSTNGGANPIVRSLLERRHANVVIQQWDLSCGAAALTTLLTYQHSESLTEKQVAASLMRRPEYIAHPELIQIREGFSLLDIKRDVDARGYTGSGFGRLELTDLIEKAPLLVPIQVNGYNHFVVFRGATRDHVLLADPAWGNRTMPVDAFLASWIDYPVFGHVGFAVLRRDGAPGASTALAPTAADFTFVR